MLRGLFASQPLTLAALLVITWTVAASLPAQARQTGDSRQEAGAAEADDDEDDLFEPSNTGYIDSAVIRNRFRLRYDSARDGDRPDRAEFIYGKCRCFSLAAGQDGASRGPTADLDYQELELTYERVFGERRSWFVEIPFRSIDLTLPVGFEGRLYSVPGFENSGLGDVRAGIKYGFLATADRHLTLQVRAYFSTGNAFKNLGTGHPSIEPALLYFHRLPNRWTLESEARWWHPLSGSSDPITGASDPTSFVGRQEASGDPRVRNNDFAGEVLRFGVGASRELRSGRSRWSPVVELVGWTTLDGYSTPPTALLPPPPDAPQPVARQYISEADGDTIVNLKIGARIRTGALGSIYVGYGLALTDDVWYDDVLRVEYRRSF